MRGDGGLKWHGKRIRIRGHEGEGPRPFIDHLADVMDNLSLASRGAPHIH